PLGLRVVKKIEQIIREEMNATGAQEILMPLMHPKAIWNETGRWDSAREVMYQFKKGDKEYTLSFTHEEILLDLVRKHVQAYRDFPVKLYHFSTKFRNEPRARSGVLRGREFLMKDLYSVHTTQEDLDKYYWEVKDAYLKAFERVGFEVRVVEAAGGVFTENITHEFQLLCDSGEDTIYYCKKCDFAQNKEIAKVKEGDPCPQCGGTIAVSKSIEVGNIFRFGTVYSEKMNVFFMNEQREKKYAYLGSYGIGLTRVMGAIVEVSHDERGIMWPKSVAPYECHLVAVGSEQNAISNKTDDVYEMLNKAGVEVLYDDRGDVSAGEKFADADLIGIPVRLVVSEQTGDGVEWKERSEEKTEVITVEELIKRLATP
ncbi:MAG: aminoacyl--tRNA ligase-related protein, partial [Patescibacteria group bacterium]